MSRFEKWAVLITAAATALTGVGLFWTKYLVISNDPWSVVNHPLQPLLLKAHILAAPGLVFALGMIAFRHIWQHYRAGLRLGRRSGIITALVTVPMVVSGYLIQAVTAPTWLEIVVIVHLVTSGVFLLGLAAHQVAMLRSEALNGSAGRRPTAAHPRTDERGDRVTRGSGVRTPVANR